MEKSDVSVIGGGAAGLFASIAAARAGARTMILEHMDRVGKKILSTGSGKCNFANASLGSTFYRGSDPSFAEPALGAFGLSETLSFFGELGIRSAERGGRYYPASSQASSVLDVLRMECARLGVMTKTSCQISSVKKRDGGFLISTSQGDFFTKAVIFAPGLLAAPKTGSDGSAIPYIESLGHRVIDIVPALVPLKGKQSFFKALAGIRAEANVKLYVKDGEWELAASDRGELQLTDYGISGIPVFQVSRFATRALSQGGAAMAVIDFLPDMGEGEALSMLRDRLATGERLNKNAGEAMIGLFNKKLGEVLLKESGIPLRAAAGDVGEDGARRLRDKAKGLRVDITGSKGFDSAQACAGGVDTSEVDARTMESKIVRGVYFAGEVLDIDGECGGYNLQWAWSSGHVAGCCAAECRA